MKRVLALLLLVFASVASATPNVKFNFIATAQALAVAYTRPTCPTALPF
jgi:hypothetical protein